jgi:hypothetical protein
MKSVRTGILGVVAGGLLLGISSGLVWAQPPTRHLIDETTAVRSSTGITGQYCADLSGGEVFVAGGTQAAGLYCPPSTAPAYTPPAVSNDVPGDPDQGSQ